MSLNISRTSLAVKDVRMYPPVLARRMLVKALAKYGLNPASVLDDAKELLEKELVKFNSKSEAHGPMVYTKGYSRH